MSLTISQRPQPFARYVQAPRRFLLCAIGVLAFAAIGCGRDKSPTSPDKVDTTKVVVPPTPVDLVALGHGNVFERYTAEVWVRGTTAYTSTWSSRGINVGDAIKIWDVSGNQPLLVDSLVSEFAATTGDVQVSDDGQLLAVANEPRPVGALELYSLANPRKPQFITRYTSPNVLSGVHTAEIQRVNGVLYAFCSIDPANNIPAKLVILDLSTPSAPKEVSVLTIGQPYIHDVFVRNGLLFTGEWNDGVGIWDIGAMGTGTPSAPKRLGSVKTVGGQVHNIWWFIDPTNNSKRYAFIGEEGPGAIGSSSAGAIHVVDVSNFSAPIEVAAYSVPGAGTHNFSMDEPNGLLYAAYYNGGIRVLDVRGDLSTCTSTQKLSDGRCDLAKMGREVAHALVNPVDGPLYFWGVQVIDGSVYASDMLTGLWKYRAFTR